MALFPCSTCGKRFAGRAHYVYPALVSGNDSIRNKHRLCPPCYGLLTEYLDPYQVIGTEVEEDLAKLLGLCPSCDQSLDEGASRVFVTTYPAKDDRHDYWLAIHTQCDLPPALNPLLKP